MMSFSEYYLKADALHSLNLFLKIKNLNRTLPLPFILTSIRTAKKEKQKIQSLNNTVSIKQEESSFTISIHYFVCRRDLLLLKVLIEDKVCSMVETQDGFIFDYHPLQPQITITIEIYFISRLVFKVLLP